MSVRSVPSPLRSAALARAARLACAALLTCVAQAHAQDPCEPRFVQGVDGATALVIVSRAGCDPALRQAAIRDAVHDGVRAMEELETQPRRRRKPLVSMLDNAGRFGVRSQPWYYGQQRP